MTPNPITVKYLKERIEAAVTAHPWFNSSVVGEAYDFDENVPSFPTLWIVPNQLSPQPQDRITEISFYISAIDRVDDTTAEVDVLSACGTALHDIWNTLMASLRTGGDNQGEMWRLAKMEGKDKIIDSLSDHVVNGWMVELFFHIPFEQGTCNIPS